MTGELPKFSKRAEEAIANFRGLPLGEPPKMKRRPIQDMAGLIDALKAKHHLGSAAPEDIIRERWAEIVGAANAAYSHAAQFDQDGRRLLILASHSVVRSGLPAPPDDPRQGPQAPRLLADQVLADPGGLKGPRRRPVHDSPPKGVAGGRVSDATAPRAGNASRLAKAAITIPVDQTPLFMNPMTSPHDLPEETASRDAAGGARPALYDLTVRVGCSLAYEATGPASLLLNLRPRPDRRHAVVFEALALGNRLPAQAFTDRHGNRIWRVELAPGTNCFRHDAIVALTSRPDNDDLAPASPAPLSALPASLLRYTLPSRYCDSDKLARFAWDKFGQVEHGRPRVDAISHWLHRNLEYRHCSGRSDLSAWDVLAAGLRRLPRLRAPGDRAEPHLQSPRALRHRAPPRHRISDPDNPMDFHAYAEVYLGGHWFTTDARFHVPRIGRIKIACGLDAVEGAFSTIYGGATLSCFQVWAYQVARGAVGVGDPLDFSRRLDNRETVQTETPYQVR